MKSMFENIFPFFCNPIQLNDFVVLLLFKYLFIKLHGFHNKS